MSTIIMGLRQRDGKRSSQQAPRPLRLCAAARKLLKRRFRRLLKTIRRCARPDCAPEDVHELRIATRRADAALRTFAAVVPRKRSQALRRILRRLRRFAGIVRNLDVLIDSTASRVSSDAGEPDVLWVLAELRSRRDFAEQALADVVQPLTGGRFNRRLLQIEKRVRWRSAGSQPTLSSAAALLVRPEVDRFLKAARRDLSDIVQLHRMRLQGKRIRYTFELLREVTDSGRDHGLVATFKSLQEHLGGINDHATAEDLLVALRDSVRDDEAEAQLGCLIGAHRRALAGDHAAFLDWWSPRGRRETVAEIEKALVSTAKAGAALNGRR